MARVKVVTLLKKRPVGKDKKTKKFRKNKTKNRKKCKKDGKKEIFIGPKLRLDPRPTLLKNSQVDKTDPMKIETVQVEQRPGNLISSNMPLEEIRLPNVYEEESNTNILPSFTPGNTNTYGTVRSKIGFLKSSAIKGRPSSSIYKWQWNPKLKMRVKMRRSLSWRDRELLNLAAGLQKYGFQDVKSITDLVKTKNEKQIREYIRVRSIDARAQASANAGIYDSDSDVDTESTTPTPTKEVKSPVKQNRGRPKNKWTKVSHEHLPMWPNIRKWRRLAFEQMLVCARSKDYSKSVLTALLQRFCDEEEEPSDAQVVNVKSIYKYLLDCVSGQIPGQLLPKESAIMIDMLRDIRLLPMVYDFDEESKFLTSYKEAVRYRPIQVKEEFKKKFVKTESQDDGFCPNCVSVPEEVFMNLSRHKRVVQSFNPLMIPVWMMQKEQEFMEQFV